MHSFVCVCARASLSLFLRGLRKWRPQTFFFPFARYKPLQSYSFGCGSGFSFFFFSLLSFSFPVIFPHFITSLTLSLSLLWPPFLSLFPDYYLYYHLWGFSYLDSYFFYTQNTLNFICLESLNNKVKHVIKTFLSKKVSTLNVRCFIFILFYNFIIFFFFVFEENVMFIYCHSKRKSKLLVSVFYFYFFWEIV